MMHQIQPPITVSQTELLRNPKEVAFISIGLSDRETLINALRPNVVVVDLDDGAPGLKQLIDYLHVNDGVQALHLVTHGGPGRIDLGISSLTNKNLATYKHELEKLGALLGDFPEIYLYGCEIGAGVAGAQFVDSFSKLTGANVAASTNLTGAQAQGGDWNLELTTAPLTMQSAFLMPQVQSYTGTLAVNDENFDSSFVAGVTASTLDLNGWTYFSQTNPQDFYVIDSSYFGISLDLMDSPSDRILYFDTPSRQFSLKSSDGSEFKLDSFDIANAGPGTVIIYAYQNGSAVYQELINLSTSSTSSQITYTKSVAGNFGSLSFGSQFQNIDEIKLDFGADATLQIDNLNVSAAVLLPTITSATFNASTGVLSVTGTDFAATVGAANDVIVSRLTMTGEGGSTYTLTSSNVDISSSTSFDVTLNATDLAAVKQILNKNGTSSTGGSTYNIAASSGWLASDGSSSDTTGNGITVSNVASPTITSATLDASTGVLVVTGTGFLQLSGSTNDISVNKLTLSGEASSSYTLTSSDVEITSGTSFTVALNSTDLAAVSLIFNKSGTSSTGATTYNLSAAEDWAAGAEAAVVVADLVANGITTFNVPVPAITSATYDGNSGLLVFTGTGFKQLGGISNDIIANKFTVRGEGGASYTLTDTANVDVTSVTSFTLTLSATDKTAVDQLLNKNGTSSVGSTTYNIAAAEEWAAGADAAVVVADLTGNGITVSNAVDTVPPSAPSTPNLAAASDSGASNTDNITGSSSLLLTGTAEVGSTIRLYYGPTGATPSTLIVANHLTDGGGGWSYTVNSLPDGEYDFGVVATDASSNASVMSSLLSVIVDSTPPSAPSTPDMSAGTDSGVSSTDDITSDSTPIFTGTAEANATVTMYDTDGTTALGVATADGGGSWSITSSTLAPGSHTLFAKATDSAGNVSSVSSGIAISIDTTAPSVSAINRVSSVLTNASSVDYTVSFNENVYGVDVGDFTLTTSGTASGTIDSVAQVNASTYTVTVNALSGNGTLRLDLSNTGTGITDAAGNANGGYTSGQAYTLDNFSPSVGSVSVPANGTYLRAQNLDFTVNFNENVTVDTSGGTPLIAIILDTGGTVSANYLSGSGTGSLVFRYTIQSNDADATGVLVGTLSANGGTIRDAVGNDATLTLNAVGATNAVLVDGLPPSNTIASASFSADTGVSTTDFITSTAAQTISGTLSSNLAAGHSVEVSLDNGATWATATTTTGQNTWSLTGQTLTSSDVIKVQVVNANGAGTVWSQAYVLDTTGPTLQSTTPSDNATSVALASNVVMNFNEALSAVTGKTVNLYKTTGDVLIETIAIDDVTKVTVTGSTVTVNPTADLAEATEYYILLDSGALVDLSGNTSAAITSSTAFSFTSLSAPAPSSNDTSAPLLISTSLSSQSNNYPIDANVTLTFNESIATGSGFIEINSATDIRRIAISDPQISIIGQTLSINPTTDFQTGSNYRILIGSGAITDLSGNTFAGLNNTNSLSFTTSGASQTPHGSGIRADIDQDGFPDDLEPSYGMTVGTKDNQVVERADLFVMQLYRDTLRREADSDGLNYWKSVLENQVESRETIAELFMMGPECQEVVGSISQLYLGAFGRVPDADGLSYWSNLVRQGTSLQEIANIFMTSDEFVNANGLLSNQDFIEMLYSSILNRSSDATGISFWINQMNDGLSRGNILSQFTNSSEFEVNSRPQILATLLSLGILGEPPNEQILNDLIQDINNATPLIEIIGTLLDSEAYLGRFS